MLADAGDWDFPAALRASTSRIRHNEKSVRAETGGRDMSSQKIVRCFVRPIDGNQQPTPRYVPLEIYGLWEFMMRTRHGFEVLEPRASLWLDAEDAPEAAYGHDEYDRVT